MDKIEQINNYFKDQSLSQSKLKLLINKGVRLFNSITEDTIFEEKDARLIGSIVDDMFTFTEKEFNSIYHVGEFKHKPSLTMLHIVSPILSINTDKKKITEYKDELIKEAKNSNYGNNKYSEDRIWNDILKSEQYWDEFSDVIGKTIISIEEYVLCKNIHTTLITHPYSLEYFTNCKYQIPLYFKIEDVECKALIDKIQNINSKLIVQDLKITANNRSFKMQVDRFRYDIQQAWYLKAINSNYDLLSAMVGDYNEVVFNFITASYNYANSPLIYNIVDCTQADIDIINGIELFMWHKKNDVWDEDRDVYINNGVMYI
jgi:hypothetical protein